MTDQAVWGGEDSWPHGEWAVTTRKIPWRIKKRSYENRKVHTAAH